MFFLPALAFSLGLVIKSLLDCFIYRMRFMKIIKQGISALLFAGASWVFYAFKVKAMPSYPLQTLLISIAVFILVLLPKPAFLRHSSIFGFFKKMVYVAILAFALFILALSHYRKLVLGTPFMVIRMTGEKEKKPIALIPSFGDHQEMVDCYHVVFEDIEGKKINDAYFYGDLIGIRVKTLHFSSLLTFLGFEPCYKVDMVYNGYMEKSLYAKLPLQVIDFEKRQTLFEKIFLSYWDAHFYEYHPSKIFKTAALQSQYFPLRSNELKPFIGAFELSLYSSGIGGKMVKSSG